MNNLKKQFTVFIACVTVLMIVISFSFKKNTIIHPLKIDFVDSEGLNFLSEEDVQFMMRGKDNDLSLPVNAWDINEMEKRVEKNPFVKDAQVYRDVKGNVHVQVTQRKPIARWYHQQEKDSYIDTNGNLLPTSSGFTARVLLVEIEGLKWEQNLIETDFGKNLLYLLKFIEEDKFWSKQIAHIFVSPEGQIEMLPQVTKQRITFGRPEKVEDKFERLMIFYKKILPLKGWNAYTKVNLKFKNQIICE